MRRQVSTAGWSSTGGNTLRMMARRTRRARCSAGCRTRADERGWVDVLRERGRHLVCQAGVGRTTCWSGGRSRRGRGRSTHHRLRSGRELRGRGRVVARGRAVASRLLAALVVILCRLVVLACHPVRVDAAVLEQFRVPLPEGFSPLVCHLAEQVLALGVDLKDDG